MKYYILLVPLIVGIVSCDKKVVTEINPGNVKDELLRYGQENPENEVLIETEYGSMRVRLYSDTPLHRAKGRWRQYTAGAVAISGWFGSFCQLS